MTQYIVCKLCRTKNGHKSDVFSLTIDPEMLPGTLSTKYLQFEIMMREEKAYLAHLIIMMR